MKITFPMCLVKFIGHLYFHSYPLWILYKPYFYKIKGEELREVLDVIQIGDILLRRANNYIISKLIPGFWIHAGLCVGEKHVIHAAGGIGIIKEDILDFCKTDNIVVMRKKNITQEEIEKCIDKAKEIKNQFDVGKIGFDYHFSVDEKNVYCTEFIDRCYGGLFKEDYTMCLGRLVLLADGIYQNAKFSKIVEYRH